MKLYFQFRFHFSHSFNHPFNQFNQFFITNKDMLIITEKCYTIINICYIIHTL